VSFPRENQAVNRAREDFRERNAEAVENTKKSILEFRRQALRAFQLTKRERERTILKAAGRLHLTVSEVQARHELVRRRLSQEAVRRDVHVRVNRSLEALEEFIRNSRGGAMDESMLLAAIEDPAISGSQQEKQRRISVSELIVSVQKQMIQQTEFINVAAHELRTPIMPILTYAEILESRLGEKSEEVEAIKRNAIRLQRLAENILNVARLDSNTLLMRAQPFDLNKLLEETIREKSINRPAHLRFIASPVPVEVYADSERILQVISNLVDNALKFAPSGEVKVTVSTNDRQAIVRVSDNGPGIDPALFPLLFTKFGAKSQGGTGLGLFISKGIIEAHGGSITARNRDPEEGTGAVFEFRLPLYREGSP
jgi:signal transduction histidine kinase